VRLDKSITDLIHRVDHLHSALTESRPRFTMEDAQEESLNSSPSSPLVYTPASFSGITNSALLNILHQLRDASEFLENLEDPVPEDVFFSFGIKRARIEDNLFRLRPTVDGGPIQDRLSAIEQCCRVSALLYIQTALTKVNCKVYHGLVETLRHGIEQVGQESIQAEYPDLLLWMLLVGGGAAPFNIDRLWYMRAVKKNLYTDSWVEVEQRLEGWPWRPKYCVPWRATWREATQLYEKM